MTSLQDRSDTQVHVFLTPTKQILLIKIGGTRDDALGSVREQYQDAMFYASLNETAITDAGLVPGELKPHQVNALTHSSYEIIPAAVAAA